MSGVTNAVDKTIYRYLTTSRKRMVLEWFDRSDNRTIDVAVDRVTCGFALVAYVGSTSRG